MDGSAFGKALTAMFIFAIVLASLVTAAVILLGPKLWAWLKPIIHSLTA
jgi:hypothetical protein